MKVVFCTSDRLASRLIRAATWSEWSHVGLIVDEDPSGTPIVVEAVWPRVRVVPLTTMLAGHTRYAFVDFPATDPSAVARAALSQVSKPYDLTALPGLLLRRDWQRDDRWFCSELVSWAFHCAHAPLFRPDALHRITPQHLWMLAPASE